MVLVRLRYSPLRKKFLGDRSNLEQKTTTEDDDKTKKGLQNFAQTQLLVVRGITVPQRFILSLLLRWDTVDKNRNRCSGGFHTPHKQKNHTPNLRCFFLQPTTTTANDGHVAINRSKLARGSAFSCESALRSLLAKKRWFRRRIRDARGKRKSERSYYTHARRHKTQQLATGTRKSSGIYDLHTQTRNTQTG